MGTHQDVSPFLRRAARSMRKGPIDVEENLWWRLRGRKLGGLKFRRQHPIGGYIADFACLEAKLIVEVDGTQHQGSEADVARTRELNRIGFQVIRFDNDRVRAYLDEVCEEIFAVANEDASRPPHPTPRKARGHLLPQRGEG